MTEHFNAQIADRLEEVAGILADQGANPYRVLAYRRAALTLRGLGRPVSDLIAEGGLPALEALTGIGESLAHSIASLATSGRLPMLERLRGASDPVALLATVPGIGSRTARRIHHDLGVDTLEELEAAAHDGRLAALLGSELEDINSQFPTCDVALVIGGNDVVIPAARKDTSSPIYGIPMTPTRHATCS